MNKLLKRVEKFIPHEAGNVAIVMAFLFPVILLLGGLALAGTNYQSLAAQVKAAAQSAATVGGVTGTTQSNISAFCIALVANSGGKISSCAPTSGSLMTDNTFCDSNCTASAIQAAATQVKVCGALVNFNNHSLGNVCSTAVVAGNKISAVTTGITGDGGLVPIALNGCMFNNGGTQNSGKGHTFWDDDNHKPFSSFTTKKVYLAWGHGDDDGVDGSYDSYGTGGRYQSGTDKQGKSHHFCSNTGNFLDFTTATSSGTPVASTIFNNAIAATSSTSTSFGDGKNTTYRAVDLSKDSSITGPTWLGSGKTLNIGDKVQALGGMADNSGWYTALNLTAGGTYLFPVITSYPDSGSLGWGVQGPVTVTAFAPMTVNKVCLGSLGNGYINQNGVEYVGPDLRGSTTGCDYGNQPYTVPSGSPMGGMDGKKIWLPYLDVGYKTNYKARNTTHKNINGNEGKNYGADGAIKRYRNDETRE